MSKTPGRTQLINFFAVADGGRLVDLPGYGYAKAAKARRDAWGRAIDDYLNHRTNLVGIVLVMDARRPLQPFDAHMIDWAKPRSLPLLALLNKADKLKQGARVQTLRNVQRELGENCPRRVVLGTDRDSALLVPRTSCEAGSRHAQP